MLFMGLDSGVNEYIKAVIKRRSPRLFACPSANGLTWPTLMSQCAVCRSWPSAQVCTDCVCRFSQVALRCRRCAIALPERLFPDTAISTLQVCADCSRQTPPLDEACAAVDYAYPWSGLISRYKFADQPGWAPFFAGLMLAAPGIKPAFDALNREDWIIPVPLSPERLQTRGFNQSWELANALARQSQTRGIADAGVLVRVRHTRAQTALQRPARLENVKDAFQVDPLRAPLLDGRRVVLVDDVMTSGASIYTAAMALRAAGAVHITGVVLARTASQ